MLFELTQSYQLSVNVLPRFRSLRHQTALKIQSCHYILVPFFFFLLHSPVQTVDAFDWALWNMYLLYHRCLWYKSDDKCFECSLSELSVFAFVLFLSFFVCIFVVVVAFVDSSSRSHQGFNTMNMQSPDTVDTLTLRFKNSFDFDSNILISHRSYEPVHIQWYIASLDHIWYVCSELNCYMMFMRLTTCELLNHLWITRCPDSVSPDKVQCLYWCVTGHTTGGIFMHKATCLIWYRWSVCSHRIDLNVVGCLTTHCFIRCSPFYFWQKLILLCLKKFCTFARFTPITYCK